MSKFQKPKPAVTEAAAAAVIERAKTDGTDQAGEVRFTMTLPADLAAAVDKARRPAALTRLAWIRLAVAEKLDRETNR